MSCDSLDEEKQQAFQDFVQNFSPPLSVYEDKFNHKIYQHPNFGDLPAEYLTFVRSVKQQLDLFREESIPLMTASTTLGQKYATINASITIEHEGKDLTPQQAGKLLDAQDRELRRRVWEKLSKRRAQDQEAIEDIFDEMIQLRHKIALQAGFDTYTDYRFVDRGRFDYTIKDTHDFHQAVEQVVKPVCEWFHQERKAALGVETLRPYDLQVDIFGSEPLAPFQTAQELFEGAERILTRLKPELGEMLRIMDERGFMDLGSRKGKMPGGYNYPLMETGIPFVFMNAAGSTSDVITLLHESGHAVHSFLTRDVPLSQRNPPSEVAELAAMTMEMLCLDKYDEFYPDPADRSRAQKNQLYRCISVLSWIAAVDAFQQWVYDHPGHSREERAQAWQELYVRFHGETVDWTGYEPFLHGQWLKQSHIFEHPFYYIEYGLAQLGALAIWKNYRTDPGTCLQNYLSALSLGYTKTIPEIYEAAGIKFDFSEAYVAQSVNDCFEAYKSW